MLDHIYNSHMLHNLIENPAQLFNLVVVNSPTTGGAMDWPRFLFAGYGFPIHEVLDVNWPNW